VDRSGVVSPVDGGGPTAQSAGGACTELLRTLVRTLKTRETRPVRTTNTHCLDASVAGLWLSAVPSTSRTYARSGTAGVVLARSLRRAGDGSGRVGRSFA
jgi:hypothetical protein